MTAHRPDQSYFSETPFNSKSLCRAIPSARRNWDQFTDTKALEQGTARRDPRKVPRKAGYRHRRSQTRVAALAQAYAARELEQVEAEWLELQHQVEKLTT